MSYSEKNTNTHTTKMCEELKIESLYLVIWTIVFFFFSFEVMRLRRASSHHWVWEERSQKDYNIKKMQNKNIRVFYG